MLFAPEGPEMAESGADSPEQHELWARVRWVGACAVGGRVRGGWARGRVDTAVGDAGVGFACGGTPGRAGGDR